MFNSNFLENTVIVWMVVVTLLSPFAVRQMYYTGKDAARWFRKRSARKHREELTRIRQTSLTMSHDIRNEFIKTRNTLKAVSQDVGTQALHAFDNVLTLMQEASPGPALYELSQEIRSMVENNTIPEQIYDIQDTFEFQTRSASVCAGQLFIIRRLLETMQSGPDVSSYLDDMFGEMNDG